MGVADEVDEPAPAVEVPERKVAVGAARREHGLAVRPEPDRSYRALHPDRQKLLVEPQVDEPHEARRVADGDDVDRRALRDGRDGAGCEAGDGQRRRKRVEERSRTDVVQRERAGRRGEDDLVEVRLRVEQVRRREVGRERDGRRELCCG